MKKLKCKNNKWKNKYKNIIYILQKFINCSLIILEKINIQKFFNMSPKIIILIITETISKKHIYVIFNYQYFLI